MKFSTTTKHLGAAAFVCAAVFASCTDLEPEVFSDTVAEEVASSELPLVDDPAGVLVSTYNGLRDFTNQEFMYSLGEHSSDEMMGPTRGTDWFDTGAWQQLHTHTWRPTNPRIIESFTRLSNRYFGATQVIAATQDPALLGQAHFLRAFYMGNMLDLFGQVPFREATEGIGINPRVLTRAEAHEFVVNDLEEAISLLPDFTPGAPGTISKQAAEAYLARMIINKAVYTSENAIGPFTFAADDMTRVETLCDNVINSGLFSLQAAGSYFQMFSADNSAQSTESIFALEFDRGDGIGEKSQNFYRMTTHYNQDVDGWNGFTTVSDFYNKWDQDDERFSAPPLAGDVALNAGFLEGQQFKIEDGERVMVEDRAGNPLIFTPEVNIGFAAEGDGIRVIKYYPDFQDLGDPANDYVFLRLADVYLMKAEAQLRNSNESGAVATVNEILANRNGADPISSLSLEGMLDQRGFEMYWEGTRRSDQIRFGTFLGTYAQKEVESEPHRVLFPIPLDQVAANPNLNQNPGY